MDAPQDQDHVPDLRAPARRQLRAVAAVMLVGVVAAAALCAQMTDDAHRLLFGAAAAAFGVAAGVAGVASLTCSGPSRRPRGTRRRSC